MAQQADPVQYGGGWYGIPKERRVCGACGERIVMARAGALWFAGEPLVVYHFDCALATLKSPGLQTVRMRTKA